MLNKIPKNMFQLKHVWLNFSISSVKISAGIKTTKIFHRFQSQLLLRYNLPLTLVGLERQYCDICTLITAQVVI